MSAQHGASGKWCLSGVPHRGWICVGDDDLGDNMILCEMCEGVRVRYVHYMEHQDYPDRLSVGCICAGHMEGDQDAAQERESFLKRRRSWLGRNWRTSSKGNAFLNTDGFNIVIWPAGINRWQVRIENRKTQASRSSSRPYDSLRDAKIGALKGLIWARENL